VTVLMSKFSAPVTAKWFDPTTGKTERISDAPLANTGNRSFTPARTNSSGESDWVLILEQ
jgi:hypothetical protein